MSDYPDLDCYTPEDAYSLGLKDGAARIVDLEAALLSKAEQAEAFHKEWKQAVAERDDYKAVAIDTAKDQARLTAELAACKNYKGYSQYAAMRDELDDERDAKDAALAMLEMAEDEEVRLRKVLRTHHLGGWRSGPCPTCDLIIDRRPGTPT